MIGHREVTAALEGALPPVTLLTGPRSVGKQALAAHLAGHHRIAAVDRLTCTGPLTIAVARRIVTFVAKAPLTSPFKLVTIDLDGASGAALNAMLKTLEEPPPSARFILTAAGPALPTITSRAQVFRLGLLTDGELRAVLISLGQAPAAAGRAAAIGRGQVDAALAADHSETARAAMLAVVRAVAIGDRELFDRAFKGFDDASRDLLGIWLREAITGQWAVFTEADTFGLHRDQGKVRKMLVAVSQLSAARPRLGVRAALEPFLSTA